MQNKGPKYNVSTTARCPLCDDDIQVGTAGPQGLQIEQHQGKKKCLATIAKKKELEEGRNGAVIVIPNDNVDRHPLKTYVFVALLRNFLIFLEISFFGLTYPFWEGRGEGSLTP